MSEDIIKLACEAIEDEKRGTPGPAPSPWFEMPTSGNALKNAVERISYHWLWGRLVRDVYFEQRPRPPGIGGSTTWALDMHDHADWWVIALVNLGAGLRDAGILTIAARRARTREPQLARGLIEAHEEIKRLRAVRRDECTCRIGDATAPWLSHERTCPIRVNRLKRIPPGVALDRLARALDSGEENEQLRSALNEACDLADEANGDPSSCSHNVMIGERIAELRQGTTVADILAERDAALAEVERLRARLEISPFGDDKIDELSAALDMIRAERDAALAEKKNPT